MRRNKNTFLGINHVFFTMMTIITWSGIAVPLKLNAQTDILKSSKADSAGQINELKEVQIRKIKNTRRQASSTPLQILSGSELQKLNSLSVADAVRFFAGAQLKDYGGIGGLKTIDIRSMGTNHTAVFYDGIQLGNAQNGQVDLGKFSLDNIEEIELYNGQKSSIFQSAKGFASGSSLYLNAKQPDFNAGKSNNIKLSFKTGSFGLLDPSLLWQSKLSSTFSSTISAGYTKANGRYKFRIINGAYDTTAIRSNSDVKRMRVEAGINGLFKDSSLLTTKIYFYNDEMGLPGAVVNNKFDYDQRAWSSSFFAQSSYKKDFNKRYSLLAATKYAYDYTRYLDPEYVTVNGLLDNRFHQHEMYFSVAGKYQVNTFWDIVLSTDYQLNTLDANLYRFAYPTRNTALLALATEWKFSRLDVQANLLGTFVDDQVKYYTGAGQKHELTPTVMASWQPFKQKEFRIRSFYKNIFRMPTFNDLYYTFIGNTILRPEYTKQYDVGFTYVKAFENKLINQFSVQADAYFNQVKDKIVAVPGANIKIWSMSNLDRVQIKGFDLNMQGAWTISQVINFNTGVTYTYQQALDVTPGAFNYERQIPYTPKHSGSFLVGADWRNIAVNYSFIYTGERYNQKANTVYNYVQPWYTHDIAFHYQTAVNKQKLELTAEINNLLNQGYEIIANFPMPGRSYRFTLAYIY